MTQDELRCILLRMVSTASKFYDAVVDVKLNITQSFGEESIKSPFLMQHVVLDAQIKSMYDVADVVLDKERDVEDSFFEQVVDWAKACAFTVDRSMRDIVEFTPADVSVDRLRVLRGNFREVCTELVDENEQ